jgi:hypothetical protein
MNDFSKNELRGTKLLLLLYLLVCPLAIFQLYAQKADRGTVRQQLQEITAGFMPSPQCAKVKIPGLREQVLEHKPVWQSLAPGFVNVPTNVVISGDVITMEIDIGGLMQSRDGGSTWNYLTYHLEGGITGREYYDFDINPKDPRFIVIGGDLIYCTADGGKTWHESHQGLPPLKYASKGNSYGQVKYTADGSVLFTALGTKTFEQGSTWGNCIKSNYHNKSVLFSSDNGNSFSRIDLSAPAALIKRIYAHPTRPEVVYFSFEDGSFYLTANASALKPILTPVSMPDGYYVMAMSVNPRNPDEMLLVMNAVDGKKPARLYRATDIAANLKLDEIKINIANTPATERRFLSVGYNPNLPEQVVVGVAGTDYLLISEDNLRSFRKFHLPEKFYADGKLGHYYGQIERVFFGKSKYAVAVSRVGAWITDDNFASLRDLTMVYHDEVFGNRGVGSPANINAIAITKNNAFFSAQDHRAWKSLGNDYRNWTQITGPEQEKVSPQQPAPWGKFTWFWHIEKLFASDDGKYLYINCNAMILKKFKHVFWADKKFMCSRDGGNTWQDVTANLGCGDVYPEGSAFLKILFDPADSSRQWLLMSDALYYSGNGGDKFIRLDSPLFKQVNDRNIMFSDIALDSGHNVLYLSCKTNRIDQKAKLNHDHAPAALYRSLDRGTTWQVCNAGQNAIAALTVTESGSLVIGTLKTADQPARLIVIPWGQKYDPGMIRLTVGDTPEEISANQIEIAPVVCDGEDILAYSNNAWILSDRFFCQGPLLSRDGGKTFRWINYDLPCTNIWSAAMKDGKIMIGTTFGLMYWRFR